VDPTGGLLWRTGDFRDTVDLHANAKAVIRFQANIYTGAMLGTNPPFLLLPFSLLLYHIVWCVEDLASPCSPYPLSSLPQHPARGPRYDGRGASAASCHVSSTRAQPYPCIWSSSPLACPSP
jgi:hypothetical protein